MTTILGSCFKLVNQGIYYSLFPTVSCDLLLTCKEISWILFQDVWSTGKSLPLRTKSVMLINLINSKSLITWWVSARAETSLRPPGTNIVVITCSISARAQNANFREKVYWGAKTQSMHMLAFLFRPGLKFRFDYMRLFQIFRPVWPGWKS